MSANDLLVYLNLPLIILKCSCVLVASSEEVLILFIIMIIMNIRIYLLDLFQIYISLIYSIIFLSIKPTSLSISKVRSRFNTYALIILNNLNQRIQGY